MRKTDAVRSRENEQKETFKKVIQVVKVKDIVSPTRELTVEMKRSRLIHERFKAKINKTRWLIKHGGEGGERISWCPVLWFGPLGNCMPGQVTQGTYEDSSLGEKVIRLFGWWASNYIAVVLYLALYIYIFFFFLFPKASQQVCQIGSIRFPAYQRGAAQSHS